MKKSDGKLSKMHRNLFLKCSEWSGDNFSERDLKINGINGNLLKMDINSQNSGRSPSCYAIEMDEIYKYIYLKEKMLSFAVQRPHHIANYRYFM